MSKKQAKASMQIKITILKVQRNFKEGGAC